MSVFNFSFLDRECNLINTQKALALIVSMCNFHVIFLPKITPSYFTPFTN
jgi:hypothetical protein